MNLPRLTITSHRLGQTGLDGLWVLSNPLVIKPKVVKFSNRPPAPLPAWMIDGKRKLDEARKREARQVRQNGPPDAWVKSARSEGKVNHNVDLMVGYLNHVGIGVRDLHKWRWLENVGHGEIQGIPGLRGKPIMTNGVLAIMEVGGLENCVRLVHYDSFVEDIVVEPKVKEVTCGSVTSSSCQSAKSAQSAKKVKESKCKVSLEALADLF